MIHNVTAFLVFSEIFGSVAFTEQVRIKSMECSNKTFDASNKTLGEPTKSISNISY